LAKQDEARRKANEVQERQNADEIVQWGGEFWGGVGSTNSAGSGSATSVVTGGAADASAVMMAALAIQVGLEASAEPDVEGHDNDDDDDDDIDDGLEDMLPVEEAVGEDDLMDAVVQSLVAEGNGDTEEDDDPVIHGA
jgi:hypothetical protein